jgi:hypothetical protein
MTEQIPPNKTKLPTFRDPRFLFTCCVCGGLLDCRATHVLYVNGQRGHNQCIEERARQNAVKQQSSLW